VPNNSKANTITTSIRYWANWGRFTVVYLTEDKRLRGVTSLKNRQYAEYLLRLSYTPELYGVTSLTPYIEVY
jgi:hypothetical protein